MLKVITVSSPNLIVEVDNGSYTNELFKLISHIQSFYYLTLCIFFCFSPGKCTIYC